MNLDEDLDAFEIQDFSIASAWERLIASMEGILRKWQQTLSSSSVSSSSGTSVLVETVEYNRRTLFVRFHTNGKPASVLELCDSANDFCWNAHPLSRWFGFSSFVTVESDAVQTELDDARLLLSSLAIALDQVDSFVAPVFVAHGRERPRDYIGYMRGGLDSAMNFCAKVSERKA
jgi:Rab3 GTPase-activating protein catalytic subunit